MQIVRVKYYSETTHEFSSREYSYYSVDSLKVGDLVTVPVRDTAGKAMVTAVDLLESSIAAFADKIKTIPAGSLVKESILPVEPDYTINLCDSCDHELPTCSPVEADFGPNDNVFKCTGHTPKLGDFAETPETPETKPATVSGDEAFIALKDQIESIVKFAPSREIMTTDDLIVAGNDLIIIRKLEKTLDALRRKWVDPLAAQVKAINDTFKELSGPLSAADSLTEHQITKYKADVEYIRKQAEELNRQAEELSRKQAAANNGEFTVDTTPVTAPAPVAKTVRSEVGSVSTRGTWKAEVTDFKALSDEFKLPDMATLNTLAKSRKGVNPPAGVRFYLEESLSTRSK